MTALAVRVFNNRNCAINVPLTCYTSLMLILRTVHVLNMYMLPQCFLLDFWSCRDCTLPPPTTTTSARHYGGTNLILGGISTQNVNFGDASELFGIATYQRLVIGPSPSPPPDPAQFGGQRARSLILNILKRLLYTVRHVRHSVHSPNVLCSIL